MKPKRCPGCRGWVRDADDMRDHDECIRQLTGREREPYPDPTPREPRL